MWWREIGEVILVSLIVGSAGALFMALGWWLGS
jgi:hypothetical protein